MLRKFLMLGGFLLSGSAFAQSAAPMTDPPQVAIGAASRDAVFVTKDAMAQAVAARANRPPGSAGPALAALAAVRAGDDRINVDVLHRVDAKAEGPVSHNLVTEVYYITDGGGLFETGGRIPDAKPMTTPAGAPVNPANIGPSVRGETIVGGTTRHVAAGDVVMIPPNIPHRFKTLDGSVTYIVVRVNPRYEAGR